MKSMFCCRICNFNCTPFMPWGQDGHTPSYAICPNCGAEFGYEDASEAGIENYRKKHLIAPFENDGMNFWKKQRGQ
ncbi:MAG: hypothetical protein KBF33_08030 [Comamonas sp.]|nr:hypothetical protein [Comamonas sp.]